MRRSPLRACTECGRETRNLKYCSNQCQKDHEWRLARQRITESGSIPARRCGQSRLAKRFMLEIGGRRCAICGITEWRGQPVPLVLDHVNGLSSDWRVSNLRLVCGNCDMLLPTFKSRGRGRAWRRERYEKGLSY